MIRPARPEEAAALNEIARASGLFAPHELEELASVIAAHFEGELGEDHHWIVHANPSPSALAYFAPEAFAEGVWNLYLLAVHPDHHGVGHGEALVRHVEAHLSRAGARILLIETSGLPRYERTRAFYHRCGYEEEARIRDYYASGDDKVVYRKVLAGPPVGP